MNSTRLLFALLLWPALVQAQPGPSDWNGEWLADGSQFRLRVSVEDDEITVSEVESLGFIWSAEPGVVDEQFAYVAVAYAGVEGVIEVEWLGPGRALARAASCGPEYMLICNLVAGQQALFLRVSEDDEAP